MLQLILKSIERDLALFKRLLFKSGSYWEKRYKKGGNSGAGSYGRLAEFKAEVLNNLVSEKEISTVVEFGVGDGNQLTYYEFPAYVGLDISETAIKLCKEKFKNDQTKSFYQISPGLSPSEKQAWIAELSLSIDVIYHLVEDATFENYMHDLFKYAQNYVAIYSSNTESGESAVHVRDRKFTDWIDTYQPEWTLTDVIENKYPIEAAPEDGENSSRSQFYIFSKA